MSIATARMSATDRFKEVRSFLSLIRAKEQSEALSTTDDTKMLRGLFWVHLYAAFEYAVNTTVQETLREISSLKIVHSDVERRFNTITLSRKFQAYVDSKGKRLRKRIEIYDAQNSRDICIIDDSIFAEQLMNVWAADLRDVCECFCVDPASVGDASTMTHVDEIVERRNSVAHGRESPVAAGSRMNSNELENRLIIIQTASEKLADSFEAHVAAAGFIRLSERAKYASA